MAKNINPLVDGFRIGYIRTILINLHACLRLYSYLLYYSRDLINEDGVMFEIGDDINNNEDDEEFSYSPHVQFSNEEMLNMLNMNSIEDEDEDEKETVSLCGMSFSKLKTKMTSLTPNGKVNQILYYFVYFLTEIILFLILSISLSIQLNEIMNVILTSLI